MKTLNESPNTVVNLWFNNRINLHKQIEIYTRTLTKNLEQEETLCEINKVATQANDFTFFLDFLIQIVDVNVLTRRDIAGEHRHHRESETGASKDTFSGILRQFKKGTVACPMTLLVYNRYGRCGIRITREPIK